MHPDLTSHTEYDLFPRLIMDPEYTISVASSDTQMKFSSLSRRSSR